MGATEITVIHGNHKVVDLNPFKTLSSTIKALLWTQVYVVIGFLQTHCFVLILVGVKHKFDFQVHLDIQNLMLVLMSKLHRFNKTFVYFTNNSAILP